MLAYLRLPLYLLCIPLWLLLAASLGAQDAPPRYATFELRAGRDALSNGAAAWEEQGIALRYRHATRTGAGLFADRLERFGLRDERLGADASVGIGSRLTLGVEGEMSPTHAVVARRGGAASLHVALGSGWGVQLRGSERRYDAARVRAGAVTVERYWGNLLGAYTVTPVQLAEENPVVTHAARLTRFFGARGSLTLMGATGKEAEALATSGPLVVPVKSGGLWGVLPLLPHLSLTAAASVTNHQGLFTRRHLSVGARIGPR